MTGLQYLSLNLPVVPVSSFLTAGSLINLRHCSLGGGAQFERHYYTTMEAAEIFKLPHLISLNLPSIAHDSSILGPEDAAACERAIAPLGDLRSLLTLKFGQAFVAGDAVFVTLQRLTQLTSLRIGSISLSIPMTGKLLLLQLLGGADTLSPRELLRTLLPLTPLAALQVWGGWCKFLILAVGTGTPAQRTEEGADLKKVCDILAATGVTIRDAVLMTTGHPSLLPRISPVDMIMGMAPLGGHIMSRTLSLRGQTNAMAVEWVALRVHLTCLTTLRVRGMTMSDAFLIEVVGPWVQLLRLLVVDAKGLTNEGWLAFAASRSARLTVTTQPPAESDLVHKCHLLQDKLHGRRNMSFGLVGE